MKHMFVLAVLALFATAPITTDAGELQFGAGCRLCGRKTCCVTSELKKVAEECWDVDCKEICIPRVRFPWSTNCEPQCGRVRAVKFLKVEEYEVQRCEYEWTILDLCDSCRAQYPEWQAPLPTPSWSTETPSKPLPPAPPKRPDVPPPAPPADNAAAPNQHPLGRIQPKHFQQHPNQL